MPDRFKMESTIVTEPIPSGIDRVFTCRLEIHLPGFSGLAERTVAGFFEEQANAVSAFTEKYLASVGAAGAQPSP